MKKLLALLIKRSIFLIMLLGCVMLYSSCAGYTANAPAGQFSREDWNTCGFKPWAGRDELETRFGTKTPTVSGQTHNILQWLCGDGMEEPGKPSFWSESADISGGEVSISCNWIVGENYKRLYTDQNWTLTVKNMSAGIPLPRGLRIGSGLELVKNSFGLGNADENGMYYGDEENTPYAKIEDIEYKNYRKEITLAVPAGETNDERYNYTCMLKLRFDEKDTLGECGYMSLIKYRILPGLPEPEKVSEVRVYHGEGDSERVFKLDEAIDILGCIQNAVTNPSDKAVNPTHSIDIVSGGDTYTLKYGDGLIEAPDGKVYGIWAIDEDALFISVPELCTYKRSYIRSMDHKSVELSAEQEEEIKRIIGSMVPGEQDMSARGQCWINVLSGDGFDSYIYLFGKSSTIIFKGKSYRISEQDSDTIRKIYNKIFEVPMPEPDTGEEAPSITTATAVSGEPLLPGMPELSQITDALIWRIGEEGIKYKWKPSEAEELFDIIHEGGDKTLEGELKSPKYIILIRGGNRGYNYEITVGSNSIKALNGEGYQVVYNVVFPDNALEKYFPKSAWGTEDLYKVPPTGGFDEGCVHDPYNLVKNLTNVDDFTGVQLSVVSGAVDKMKPSIDSLRSGKFFAFSLAKETKKNTEEWFTYEYYIGTNYVSYEVQGLVKKSMFTISNEDAKTLTQIYTKIYSERYSELLIAIAESGEPLLPGLPSPKDITEVRIWHIGKVEITVIFTPQEAEELFGIIQAGSGKPLKGKLKSPTHKIKIVSGGKEYVLTVGSNGIKAPNGKVYSVVFTKHTAETYLFL